MAALSVQYEISGKTISFPINTVFAFSLKLLLEAKEIDLAIITDQDNIYYLTVQISFLL